MNTIEFNGLTFKKIISHTQIQKRVKEMALQLKEDTAEDTLFVCMLNGAFLFASDLLQAMNTKAEIAFVRWCSYSGTHSTDEVVEKTSLDQDITGRNVVVIEDIIDSGATMYKFLEYLKKKGANSVKIATLLYKPANIKFPVKADYVGFNIGQEFVIGYGFDFYDYCRCLSEIYALDNTLTAKTKSKSPLN